MSSGGTFNRTFLDVLRFRGYKPLISRFKGYSQALRPPPGESSGDSRRELPRGGVLFCATKSPLALERTFLSPGSSPRGYSAGRRAETLRFPPGRSCAAQPRRFIEVRKEHGTFFRYLWQWVGGRPILRALRTLKDYPVFTDEAVTWARDLKKRGFKFLEPTVVYAHMQAVGMVNDHTQNCFRYRKPAV
jgi:methyladenine glycosylase